MIDSNFIAFYLFILVIIEIAYFRLAKKLNIIDVPNLRSSHSNATIRGGGVIFVISLILYSLFIDHIYLYFLLGLVIISIVSFIDDLKSVSQGKRVVFHVIAVLLMFYQLGLLNYPYYIIFLALIVIIGCINAINFMDGINGLTGFYSLIVLGSLLYINFNEVTFTRSNFIATPLLAICVFLLFNFRTKARCFAGDVGSVSIAFIMLFFILKLIIKTEELKYILLLLVYGLDTFTTIIFRVIRKEKIFEPHRSHFYQFLANERKMLHLKVALCYGVLQLLINLLLIYQEVSSLITIIILIASLLLFTSFRFLVEGRHRLLSRKVS